jgi:hypothetical protein
MPCSSREYLILILHGILVGTSVTGRFENEISFFCEVSEFMFDTAGGRYKGFLVLALRRFGEWV